MTMRCPTCHPPDQEKRCAACSERHKERLVSQTLAEPGTIHYGCECACGASWTVTLMIAPDAAERIMTRARIEEP